MKSKDNSHKDLIKLTRVWRLKSVNDTQDFNTNSKRCPDWKYKRWFLPRGFGDLYSNMSVSWCGSVTQPLVEGEVARFLHVHGPWWADVWAEPDSTSPEFCHPLNYITAGEAQQGHPFVSYSHGSGKKHPEAPGPRWRQADGSSFHYGGNPLMWYLWEVDWDRMSSIAQGLHVLGVSSLTLILDPR